MLKKPVNILPALLLVILFATDACKKDDDSPVQTFPSCVITAPEDSSFYQIGELVSIEVEIKGFGENARVRFSVDTIQLSEDLSAPFDFQWNTEGMEVGTYTVKTDAYEPENLASDWISIILIDTIIPPQAPVPIISISPETGNTDSIFSFDALGSYDLETPAEDLVFRWDFDGDGLWDTDYTQENPFLHKYTHPSNYQVRLEVLDTDSMTADTIEDLLVSHTGNQDACQGYVTVPYAGKVYHTIAIGEQCWLRENMDIGVMLQGGIEQSNNDTIEKYCYDDDTLNCEKYGGLYQWNEMINYFPLAGAQGICPVGWHVPTDLEWKELEGFVDSQYNIGDPIWDETSFRGYDAGHGLKALVGWYSGGNGNNLYSFKGLPGGFWEEGFNFKGESEEAHFWTATHDIGLNAAKRILKHDQNGISRTYHWEKAAYSVRCIRD